MTRPIIQDLNVQTQELTVREMNDTEYAQHLIDVANTEAQAAKQAEEDAKVEAKKTAKAQALAQLGLSQEIINLLAD
jgi:hypothetical protein